MSYKPQLFYARRLESWPGVPWRCCSYGGALIIIYLLSFLNLTMSLHPWFQIGSFHLFPMPGIKWCGRSAFPISYFLLVGFLHRTNHFKYGRNLHSFRLFSRNSMEFCKMASAVSDKAERFSYISGISCVWPGQGHWKMLPLQLFLRIVASIQSPFSSSYGCQELCFSDRDTVRIMHKSTQAGCWTSWLIYHSGRLALLFISALNLFQWRKQEFIQGNG